MCQQTAPRSERAREASNTNCSLGFQISHCLWPVEVCIRNPRGVIIIMIVVRIVTGVSATGLSLS